MFDILNTSEMIVKDDYSLLDANIDQFHKEVQEKMESVEAKESSYFVRTDTGKIVQSEKEYDDCRNSGIRLKIVSYNAAVQIIKEGEAEKKKEKAKKKRRKAQRAARRNNDGARR